MSHLTRINVAVTDLNALKKAVKRMGGEFKENQKTYKWFGRFMGDAPLPPNMKVEELGHCEHAISFPNCTYEIGVLKSKEKRYSFDLFYDYWSSGGLNKAVGENAGLLKQAYAAEVAKAQALKQGYMAKEETMKDGTIKLSIMVN